MFVVRSTGLFSKWPTLFLKSSSCGEKIVYQWDCLSFPPQISLCWCSDLHLKATPENWKLCFHSDLATGLPVLVWSTFELSALSVTKAVKCTRTECYWRPIDKLRHYAPHCFFDFATARSSSPGFPSCISLFDMVLKLLVGLQWPQENIEKLMILTNRRRRFHSSRVKWPFVHMSATWFLVFTYLIWIFGSKQLCGFGTRVSSSDIGLWW